MMQSEMEEVDSQWRPQKRECQQKKLKNSSVVLYQYIALWPIILYCLFHSWILNKDFWWKNNLNKAKIDPVSEQLKSISNFTVHFCTS